MKTNEIPDIGEMYEFWQMRFKILGDLYTLKGFLGNMADKIYVNNLAEFINKIESLGKKETNDKR